MSVVAETEFVVIGDSLTEHGAWPEILAPEAGWSVRREAKAGQTSTEIALRVGATALDAVVRGVLDDGAIDLRPEALPGEVREFVHADMDDIEVGGALSGVAGVLVHRVGAAALDGWCFRPVAPAVLPIGATARFQPSALSLPRRSIITVWCGRNNPGSVAVDDVAEIERHLCSLVEDPRILVLGLHAAAFEPVGTAGATVISGVNAALESAYGDRFVDVQAALTSAYPAPDGVAASSLRVDDVHLSADGDRVLAEAIRSRLRALGWWPDMKPSAS